MTPKLFDAHTHVNFAAFQNDWETVIRRALEAGVWLVNVGTQKDTSARAVEMAQKYPEGVYATVGLHPIHTDKSFHDEQELGVSDTRPRKASQRGSQATSNKGFMSRGEEFDYEYYKKLAQDPKVVAIGECGLDYYRLEQSANRKAQIEKQEGVFVRQIELAREIKKPLMIHCREAYDDLIKILQAPSSKLQVPCPGIVHFFSGTKEQAQKLLDMGFYFTFGGVITFARDYDEVIRCIPLDRILLETDAPYVAPTPHRGQRNEPLYVVEVAREIGEIKNEDLNGLLTITTENAKNLLGLGIGSS